MWRTKINRQLFAYFILIRFKMYRSAQQAQNNAAAAAVHASIILKEGPSENIQHDEYASNHNYGPPEYKQSSPQLPSQRQQQQQQLTPPQSEYDFAGY